MQTYLNRITPNVVGDAWRTDELYIKIRGDMKYMYDSWEGTKTSKLRCLNCNRELCPA